MNELGITDGYFITREMKSSFDGFLVKLEGKNKKMISTTTFWTLLGICDIFIISVLFKYYNSVAESLYRLIITLSPPLSKNIMEDIADYVVLLLPIYLLLNFNILIIRSGHIKISKLLSPNTLKELVKGKQGE
jgi:hypothetical protein